MEKNSRIIELDNISKIYDERIVLDQISCEFQAGESVALIGHNGCGKSTLLKLISGLIRPTKGHIYRDKNLQFTYVPEKFPAIETSARKYLTYMCDIDGMTKMESSKLIEENASDFFLSEMLDIPMSSLSKGTLQKIGVIQAMINRPDILILDEPLSGQDVASQKVFINKVNEFRREGVTVFMSCHEEMLVNALSDKVYTIHNGKLIDSSSDIIKRNVIKERFLIIVENTAKQPIQDNMHLVNNRYEINVSEDELQKTVMELMNAGWTLKGVHNEAL